MPRIVGGRFGGRRLAVPPSGTRPTSDMAREGLFSTLTSLLGGLDGVTFLDLYAGSGAVGLEALSRGAAKVVFVESAPRALRVLRENVANAGGRVEPGAVVVVAEKVASVGEAVTTSGFDVVFADPPYDMASAALAGVLDSLRHCGTIEVGTVVAVERATRDAWQWPQRIEGLRSRRYGDATIWYGRAVD